MNDNELKSMSIDDLLSLYYESLKELYESSYGIMSSRTEYSILTHLAYMTMTAASNEIDRRCNLLHECCSLLHEYYKDTIPAKGEHE